MMKFFQEIISLLLWQNNQLQIIFGLSSFIMVLGGSLLEI